MKNTHVSPSHADNVGFSNNPAPLANMPAKNAPVRSVPLGTSHKSQFAKSGSVPSKAANGNLQPQRPAPATSGRPNLPSKNNTGTHVPLGTTKHGVGQVPSYLRNN
jgi:hypothetical protein